MFIKVLFTYRVSAGRQIAEVNNTPAVRGAWRVTALLFICCNLLGFENIGFEVDQYQCLGRQNLLIVKYIIRVDLKVYSYVEME